MTKRTLCSSVTILKLDQLKHFQGKVTYQDVLQSLGDSAFGLVLLFFSLPSALPLASIPSISVIFSIPILLFSVQMILGRKTLWLPLILAKRTISQQALMKVSRTSLPYLVKINHLLKPRWRFMTSRIMEIVNGMVIFCLALLLMLPIPFSNFFFAGLLILFSLGIIENDGVVIFVAYLGTVVYLSFIYLIVVAVIKHLLLLI